MILQPMHKNLILIVIIFASFLIGFFMGTKESVLADEYWFSEETSSIKMVDFELFWKALAVLDKKHPNASELGSKERVWSSIQGLAESYGDPYTTFFTPEEVKNFEENINGEFSGVGMEVGLENGYITVIAPLKNSPAEQAGILPGDVVTEIDGESALEMTIDQAVEKIRGPKGKTVILKIAREGEAGLLEFSIVRDTIELISLETSVPTNAEDVFVISLYTFSENIGESFGEAMSEFVKSGKRKLILDLRSNPGGYLSSAVDIGSFFVPQGKVIVTESFGENSEQEDTEYRSRGTDIKLPKNFKMVILVDGGSASASEIVAGALQEYGIATLVGTETFGKGSVQEYLKIDDETALKVTVAHWLTPFGATIEGQGLTPDHVVEYDSQDTEDNQLQAAIDLLTK